ncbi:MAG: DUF1810 domain-containing protein [Halothiobacillaceae bacterium]|nr:DUF1810 domain-containing protein [Halothiobacillaceae bacterium]
MSSFSLTQVKPSLHRYIDAQADLYDSALAELKRGKKTGHWMWFIFPQVKGLGSSSKSEYFGIQNSEEAKEYLYNPILGKRLIECVNALVLNGITAQDILGYPDVLKLRSSMTLFESVSSENNVFSKVLENYFQGQRDIETLELLDRYEANK